MTIQDPSAVEGVGAEPKTSGMAITAFVFSILPLCGIAQAIGLVLGIISLGKIKESGGALKGRGLATAAIAVSAAFLVILPIIAIFAGLLLPALARAREEGRKAVCRENLRNIGMAIHAYAENEGKLPSTGIPGDSAGSLALLVPDYISSDKVFRCPSSAVTDKEMAAGLTEENCCYEYDNTLSPDSAPDRMMAWDKEGNHDGGRNVLFFDGHVSFVMEDQFLRTLAEQRAASSAMPSAP